jgi:hypothetical protein
MLHHLPLWKCKTMFWSILIFDRTSIETAIGAFQCATPRSVIKWVSCGHHGGWGGRGYLYTLVSVYMSGMKLSVSWDKSILLSFMDGASYTLRKRFQEFFGCPHTRTLFWFQVKSFLGPGWCSGVRHCITTDPSSNLGCVSGGRNWDTQMAGHNWPSIVSGGFGWAGFPYPIAL